MSSHIDLCAITGLPLATASIFYWLSEITRRKQCKRAGELQTLATANGAGTISGSQSITVYDKRTGTTIYSVILTATNSTTGQTFSLTIAGDEAGNPTVPPNTGHDGSGSALRSDIQHSSFSI